MADDTVHVRGLKELGQFLSTFSEKLQKNIMRSALRSGAKVIADEAKSKVPVGAPSSRNAKIYGGYAGALRDSIKTSTRSRGTMVTGSVKAGGKGKGGANVFYAHMVEQGTDPHVIKAANGGRLAFGGGYYISVNHPGTAARPFMVPSMDSKASAAVVAVGNQIKARLTKQGLDLSDVIVEGDE